MRCVLGFLLLLALSNPALADIEKLVSPSDQGIHFYWWPIVPELDGWVHDDGASRANGFNALVPKGQTFSGAPAVIFAEALYKPRIPQEKSLDQLIRNDFARYKKKYPGITIRKLPAIKNGDGQSLPYYALESKGNWQFVAYGEEGDYYLVFSVNGKTKAARDAARGDFERLVSRYKEHL